MPSTFTAGLLIIGCFFLTALAVPWVRHYSLRKTLLDRPNERSSHIRATPRGGGLALALVTLSGFVWILQQGWLNNIAAMILILGGTSTALLGWADDHYSLSVKLRMGMQFMIVAGTLYGLGYVSSDGDINLVHSRLPLGLLGNALTVLALLWLINLYNFMDGIDGIAATQALCTGTLGTVLLIANQQPGLALACALVTACSGGFLVWNWSPAAIFMGDVGSCFLGFTFGGIALISERSGGILALIWALLLAVFLVDATLTLLHRIIRGEPWYSAHKQHAYQRLLMLGFNHAQVVWLTLAVNLLLIWPLVINAYIRPETLPWMAGLAFLILASLWSLVQWVYAVQRQ